MKKTALLAMVLVLSLSGCTAMTTTDQTGWYNPSTGKYFHVQTVTVRDRTGTDVHRVVTMDDQDKIVDAYGASGRGIVAGATDGMGAAVIHSAGIIGAAAVWPSDNYSGGNAAAGASQDQSQGQDQGQNQGQGQLQGQVSKNTNFNLNKNRNINVNKNDGGFNPPGHNK